MAEHQLAGNCEGWKLTHQMDKKFRLPITGKISEAPNNIMHGNLSRRAICTQHIDTSHTGETGGPSSRSPTPQSQGHLWAMHGMQ